MQTLGAHTSIHISVDIDFTQEQPRFLMSVIKSRGPDPHISTDQRLRTHHVHLAGVVVRPEIAAFGVRIASITNFHNSAGPVVVSLKFESKHIFYGKINWQVINLQIKYSCLCDTLPIQKSMGRSGWRIFAAAIDPVVPPLGKAAHPSVFVFMNICICVWSKDSTCLREWHPRIK